jgi:hypothetical protein
VRLDARHTEPAWAFIGVRSTLSVCYLRTFQRSGRMAHYTFVVGPRTVRAVAKPTGRCSLAPHTAIASESVHRIGCG